MSRVPWYFARAAGLVAWTLLTTSVFWGLSISTKLFRGKPRPAWMLDLHRYLGGLATIFAGLHVGAIVADSYVHFGLASILVPFASTWRPIAVAWGVVGMYLLLAVELTSLARKHLSKKLWRATHFASFPLFVLASLHALTAGTDANAWFVQGAVAVAVFGIAGLTWVRVTQSLRARSVVAPRSGAGSVLAQQRVVDPDQIQRLPSGVAEHPGKVDPLVSA